MQSSFTSLHLLKINTVSTEEITIEQEICILLKPLLLLTLLIILDHFIYHCFL